MRFPRRNRIDKKCNLDKNFRYRNSEEINAKGYWYSLGKAWYNFWYVEAQMKKVTTQVVCEVTLPKNIFTTLKKREEGKILVIDSVEDVKILTKEFGEKNPGVLNYGLLIKKLKIKGIEFRKYDKTKQEIFTQSFQVSRQEFMKYGWFYNIDVSSGCVWDPSILEVKTAGALKDFV